MALVEISLDKSIQESANEYYAKSKKLKLKLEGLYRARDKIQAQLNDLANVELKTVEIKERRQKKWFEKFRWCFTRNGLMVLAGRDTSTNEMVVKKYMESNDLHFHTNINGSAHVILKNGINANKSDFEDAGLVAAIYSKAWNEGFGSIDVYFVNPNQVSKTAQSGESLGTGAFVIRGERNWLKKVSLNFCVGVIQKNNFEFESDFLMIGSKDTFVKYNSPYFVELTPGNKQKSDICKMILKELEKKGFRQFTVDDLLTLLPAGKFDIVKNKN